MDREAIAPRILRTPDAERSDADYAHMAKVAGFVARHSAQEPANHEPVAMPPRHGCGLLGAVRTGSSSRWRYSLMNWGRDLLRD